MEKKIKVWTLTSNRMDDYLVVLSIEEATEYMKAFDEIDEYYQDETDWFKLEASFMTKYEIDNLPDWNG